MLPPPSRLPARQHVLAVATLAILLVTAIPSAFSLRSADAASSAGATGNDPRAFPKTFHIWGGYPSSYSKYDIVIGYPSWNLPTLRAANPTGIYLFNPQLDPANPDWRQRKGTAVTYGGANSFTGANDTIVDGSAASLGGVPAWNTYWDTLHLPNGTQAITSSQWPSPGWNLTRTDTSEKVAEIMAYSAKLSRLYRDGWDGVWSDNWFYRIGASWFYGSNLDTNRDGIQDNMSVVSRQWWDGLDLVGRRLRSYLPGKIVGGNGSYHVTGLAGGSDPTGPFKGSNVTMNEVLEAYTSKPDQVVSEVQSYLDFPDPHGMSRYFLLMHDLPGGQGDYRSMRWGFSLATIAGGYYEPYANTHDDAFSYDEFTGGSDVGRRGWLGQPVSAPTKLSNGVWRRDFANGVVLNNSTSSAQTVALGGTYQRLRGSQDGSVNNGASVGTVTIAAGDGLFLRGSSSQASAPQNTALPTIAGSPAVEQLLIASTGSWTGSPSTYTFQWQRCDSSGTTCANVLGGQNSSYRLVELDSGSRMRVRVTASNAVGSTTATSAATSAVEDPLSVTHSIIEGAVLSRTVTWTASPAGQAVSKVDFAIDGRVIASKGSAPYSATVDTSSLANGSHVFSVTATGVTGATARSSANATVNNQTGSDFVVTHNVTDGQAVAGTLNWTATASGKAVARAEFSVDGSVVSTDLASPYEVALDTQRIPDGSHALSVRAVATDGAVASVGASVSVSNTGSDGFAIRQSLRDGQVVSGLVDWVADPTGKRVRLVEFTVDGATIATDRREPFALEVDTRKLADGSHSFVATAEAHDGATAGTSARVTVANRAQPPGSSPPPPPAPASFSVTHSVSDGQALSGAVSWTASPVGKTVERIEFSIDGQLRWTERLSPYVYAGDGMSLDTKLLSDGAHVLSVKAYSADGSTASTSSNVVVSNPVEKLVLVSSIQDGSTITGRVEWLIRPSGKTLSRLDFYIDGAYKWTERLAPWTYGGDDRKLDTSTLSRGPHTLMVRATATDGTIAVLTLQVTVA